MCTTNILQRGWRGYLQVSPVFTLKFQTSDRLKVERVTQRNNIDPNLAGKQNKTKQKQGFFSVWSIKCGVCFQQLQCEKLTNSEAERQENTKTVSQSMWCFINRRAEVDRGLDSGNSDNSDQALQM